MVKNLINKNMMDFLHFIVDIFSVISKVYVIFPHIYWYMQLSMVFINKIRFFLGNGGKQEFSIRKLMVK